MGLEVRNVSKSFGEPAVTVLKGINFSVDEGEFISLTGRSGSGKSTLLYILSSLDTPSTGQILVDGEDISKMTAVDVHRFRNRNLGFVFQFHYLLPELSAVENVLMPALKAGIIPEKRPHAKKLLDAFGLEGKHDRLPRQLSGGEQQRVAIARAFLMNPKYIFADEPTGALDSVNGENVMTLFEQANRESRTTIIMVTHDPQYAARAGRQIRLVDGEVEADEKTK